MHYEKQTFKNGQVLTADCLNRMENGIKQACDAVPPECPSTDCSKVLSYGADGPEWVDMPQNVDADGNLDANHKELRRVSGILFSDAAANDNDIWLIPSGTKTVPRMSFIDVTQNDVVLNGIAPGTEATDAVNKAQLDAAIANASGGGGGTVGDSDINMNGHKIDNIGILEIASRVSGVYDITIHHSGVDRSKPILSFSDGAINNVILNGIAPGEQDTDAVNVAQLNDAIASVGGGSGGVSTMIVRMQNDDYADETAEVINQHIEYGGLAYFFDGEYYYPLAADIANSVSIGLIQTYNGKFLYVEIDVDGTVTYNESDYSDLADNLSGVAKDVLALMQQMGDIDTALDGIIAIQNELIGGEA